MNRIMKISLLLAAVAAIALATIGAALADGPGPGPNHEEVEGMIAVITPATTSTPPTVTIQPKEGPAMIVKVVASTLITKAGLGKATLDDLAVDDRAEAKYDKDNMEASKISVRHPVAKHHGYEGTITSIAAPGATSTSFVLTPRKGGDVTINVNDQTKYKVPGLKDASLGSFKVGNRVTVLAVELSNGWTAQHVHLIPGKPVHVERVGTIDAYQAPTTSTSGSITIKGNKGDLSTFVVATDTKVKFKQGAIAVTLGYRATVVAKRDPSTDQHTAREILVFGPKANANKGDDSKDSKNDNPKANANKGDDSKDSRNDNPKANANKGDDSKDSKNDSPKANKDD